MRFRYYLAAVLALLLLATPAQAQSDQIEGAFAKRLSADSRLVVAVRSDSVRLVMTRDGKTEARDFEAEHGQALSGTGSAVKLLRKDGDYIYCMQTEPNEIGCNIEGSTVFLFRMDEQELNAD